MQQRDGLEGTSRNGKSTRRAYASRLADLRVGALGVALGFLLLFGLVHTAGAYPPSRHSSGGFPAQHPAQHQGSAQHWNAKPPTGYSHFQQSPPRRYTSRSPYAGGQLASAARPPYSAGYHAAYGGAYRAPYPGYASGQREMAPQHSAPARPAYSGSPAQQAHPPYAGAPPQQPRPPYTGGQQQGRPPYVNGQQEPARAPYQGPQTQSRPVYGRPNQVNPQGHLGAWLEKHQAMSSTERERALRNEPGFNHLAPQTQQRLIERLRQIDSMPPQQRQRTLGRIEAMERLSPQARQQVHASVQAFYTLPADRQRMVKKAFHDLREYPPEQRQVMMASPQFRSAFNPQERGMLSSMLSVEPYLPQGRSGLETEIQSGK